MSAWRVVLVKELLDFWRDRRSVMNVFAFGALFGPLLATGMLAFLINDSLEDARKTLTIPVIGLEYAPSLQSRLRNADIELEPSSENARELVTSQRQAVVLVIPAAFPEAYANVQPAVLEIVYDEARNESQSQARRLGSALNQISQVIGAQRMLMRGVDSSVQRVFAIRRLDVSSESASGPAALLMILPYFLIMGLIQAAMFVASDATAGERERNTLEPLLINPVSTTQVILGKVLANCLVCLAVIGLSCLTFFLGTKMIPVQEIGLIIRSSDFVIVAIALVPLIMMFAPLMTFLGTFAKSVREAQTWLSLVFVLAIIPSLIQMVIQNKVVAWQLALPVWSQQYLINEVLKGGSVTLLQWLISSSGALLLGSIFLVLAVRQYRRQ